MNNKITRAIVAGFAGIALAGGATVALMPDADAANSVRANSVKVAPSKANSV